MIQKNDSKTGRRRSLRLKEFDYSQPGWYFVTIVTHQRRRLFGEVVNGKVQLNSAGNIVGEIWHGLSDRFPNVAVDLFVVMPNHIHVVVNVGRNLLRPVATHAHSEGDESRPYRVTIVHVLTKVALQFLCVKNIEFSEITHRRWDILHRQKGSVIHAIAAPRPDSFGPDSL